MRDQFRLILTRHYFDMRGRAGRAEFWYFVLACLIVYGATWLTAFALSQAAHRLTPAMNCVYALVALALLPPLAGIGARRLHDVGQSGQLVWTLIIPLATTILSGLLAREPFLMPDFIYFYWTYGGLLNLIALLALVALISFWMQPGSPGPNARRAPSTT